MKSKLLKLSSDLTKMNYNKEASMIKVLASQDLDVVQFFHAIRPDFIKYYYMQPDAFNKNIADITNSIVFYINGGATAQEEFLNTQTDPKVHPEILPEFKILAEIIQQSIQKRQVDSSNQEEIYKHAYEDVFSFLKSYVFSEQAIQYWISQGPIYAFSLAQYFKKFDESTLKKYQLILREKACEDSEYAYYFASDIDEVATEATRNAASKETGMAIVYALHIDGVAHPVTWAGVQSNPARKERYMNSLGEPE